MNKSMLQFTKWTLLSFGFHEYLSFQYPNLIEIIEIGHTYERRPILLTKISKKNNIPGGAQKRAIFIEAGNQRHFLKHIYKININGLKLRRNTSENNYKCLPRYTPRCLPR